MRLVLGLSRTRWLSLVSLVLIGFSALAAPKRLTGREIYTQQCASCHGKNGEGVNGKFDGPLQGNRTLEKLSGYIDRNMPEDDPDKLNAEDSATVAKYIYDSFYSVEARLRKNPARVELVRLTNRQYLNTVADLLKQFTGRDEAVGAERGLKATYYSSRNFSGNKKVTERVDKQVDFDFGDGNPDNENYPTNEFSIQWRGSLIVEETGEYEFSVKSPNGVRLWVNANDEEPTIDAWVSSGELVESKGTVRLIGGRVYPLRLDCFRYKEKKSSISLSWRTPRGEQQIIPTRNLATSRASRTFVVSTPFPPDDSSVGYERGVLVSKAWDEATTQAAIETANHVLGNLERLTNSKRTDTNYAAKVEAFCAEFVTTAFRRPLTAEEKKLHVADQFARTKTMDDAVKRVVLLALKSPQFLYTEFTDGKVGDYEVASRLSYEIWDSLPDRDLVKAAGKGELRTREQIAAQAQRMLRDPRARAKALAFLHHWLQMDRVEELEKDNKVFPGFSPEIIADLRSSLNLFLEDTFWSKESDYRTLLTADYMFVNEELAEFYGFEVPEGGTNEFQKVSMAEGQRSGVLTHPYLLAAFSYQKQTSPIHRGVFLTRNIVGRALRPPPIAVAFKDAEFASNLTMREKVSELTKPQSCQTCHSVINPLGFSLENFDAVGRFRTSELEKPIDTASDYLTDEGQTIRLTGARDVAKFALDNEQAQNAFIEQFFHQVVKQPALAYGADTLSQLRTSFVASDFNLQKLFVEIAVTAVTHGIDQPVQAAKKK